MTKKTKGKNAGAIVKNIIDGLEDGAITAVNIPNHMKNTACGLGALRGAMVINGVIALGENAGMGLVRVDDVTIITDLRAILPKNPLDRIIDGEDVTEEMARDVQNIETWINNLKNRFKELFGGKAIYTLLPHHFEGIWAIMIPGWIFDRFSPEYADDRRRGTKMLAVGGMLFVRDGSLFDDEIYSNSVQLMAHLDGFPFSEIVPADDLVADFFAEF